jgi:hypothetical protein
VEGAPGPVPRARKYHGLFSILLGLGGLIVFPLFFFFSGQIKASLEMIYFIRGAQTAASVFAIIFGAIAIVHREKKGALGILFGIFGLLPLVINILFPPMYE